MPKVYSLGTFDIALPDQFHKIDHFIAQASRGSNDIKVTLENPRHRAGTPISNRHDWKMELQRSEYVPGTNHFRFVTVGTREGWVSGTSPSHRTFTSVMKSSTRNMRVKFTIHGWGGGTEIRYSQQFKHT